MCECTIPKRVYLISPIRYCPHTHSSFAYIRPSLVFTNVSQLALSLSLYITCIPSNKINNLHKLMKMKMKMKMELPVKKPSLSSGSDHDRNDAVVVQDPFRFAYIIHFFLGAGNLLPWNALITAVDYFAYLYPTNHIEKVFSVAYMASSVMVLVVMMSWPRVWSKMSLRFRMNLGFSLFVLSLMVPTVIDWTSAAGNRGGGGGGGSRPSGAYGLTVVAVVICGFADGLVGGSLVGSAGKMPKQYMQAVFAGTASSGN